MQYDIFLLLLLVLVLDAAGLLWCTSWFLWSSWSRWTASLLSSDTVTLTAMKHAVYIYIYIYVYMHVCKQSETEEAYCCFYLRVVLVLTDVEPIFVEQKKIMYDTTRHA